MTNTFTHPKVSIVTPVHNGVKYTLKFLQSVKSVRYPNLEVIIVDDGSSDNSANIIAKRFPEAVILKGDGSLWWSGATNLGVEHAINNGSSFVFTVNNDVQLTPSCIQSLVELAHHHPKALIGSMICNMQAAEAVWFFGATFDQSRGDLAHHTGSAKDFKGMVKSDWLTGMGVLVPTQAFADTGLYDAKNFPQYLGDADFSLRAKKVGYQLLVTATSVIYADTTSSWMTRQHQRPTLAFIPQLFFSTKSPANVVMRYKFYRRHWPTDYKKALCRYYWVIGSGLLRHYLIAYTKLSLKRLTWRKAPK
ncbi:MAG TPA: glycosyltransferase family 2 protein [Candidatus Saccharimonadales bacterium]|nr:glycosyltransferase family 2 protein [Candidatus Saccharimonadales bacterium]